MPAQLNRIVKTISEKSVYDDCTDVIVTSSTVTQGDLCVFASNVVRAITSGDTGLKFLGIARRTTVNGVEKQPYSTDTSANSSGGKVPGPVYGVVAKLVAKLGDAFTPGQSVYPYPASGTHHVTSASTGLTAIGIYQGGTISSASTGQEIEVLLGTTINGTLEF